MKFTRIPSVGFLFMFTLISVFCVNLLGCSDDDSDSGSSDPALRSISYECLNSDNSQCAASASGSEVRAAYFSGECSSFGSSTEILSLGTATASCDDDVGCRVSSQEAAIQNWSNATLPAGDYAVYVFIDLDGNDVPNNEPNACTTVTHPSDSNPNIDGLQ